MVGILGWFAIPHSSGTRFVRTLHYDHPSWLALHGMPHRISCSEITYPFFCIWLHLLSVMVFGFFQLDGLIKLLKKKKSLSSSPLHELYEYTKIYLFIHLAYDGCLGCFPVWYNFEQMSYEYFSSVQSLSHVQLFVTP